MLGRWKYACWQVEGGRAKGKGGLRPRRGTPKNHGLDPPKPWSLSSPGVFPVLPGKAAGGPSPLQSSVVWEG